MDKEKEREEILFEGNKKGWRYIYVLLIIFLIAGTGLIVWAIDYGLSQEPWEEGDLPVIIICAIMFAAMWSMVICIAVFIEKYQVLVTRDVIKVRNFSKEKIIAIKDIDWVYTDPLWYKHLSEGARYLAKYLYVTISYNHGKIIKLQISARDTERFYRLVWALIKENKDDTNDINNISTVI